MIAPARMDLVVIRFSRREKKKKRFSNIFFFLTIYIQMHVPAVLLSVVNLHLLKRRERSVLVSAVHLAGGGKKEKGEAGFR